MKWTITEDDKKLTEITMKALHEGRQRIQTDDGVVVMISEEELARIEGKSSDFTEHLLSIPKVEEADFSRDKSPMREFEW
jgi:hypothetical protein